MVMFIHVPCAYFLLGAGGNIQYKIAKEDCLSFGLSVVIAFLSVLILNKFMCFGETHVSILSYQGFGGTQFTKTL